MTNQELGKMIKDLRQKHNMTQKELGEKLHITDKAISKWERGISMPDIEMLNSIANLFNIPVSNLIDNKIKENVRKILVEQSTKLENAREIRKLIKDTKSLIEIREICK